MLWFIFALGAGLSKSILDLLSKKFMLKTHQHVVTFSRFLYSLPFLFIAAYFFGTGETDIYFWLAVIAGVPLEIGAIYMYMKAIRLSPLSVVIPMLGLSPIFILVTSYLMLNEAPSILGLFGILVVSLGIYMVGLNNKGLLEPFKALGRDLGVRLMLATAVLYSFTPVIIKIGAQHSDVYTFLSLYVAAITLVYAFFLKAKDIKEFKNPFLVSLGLFFAAEAILGLVALKLAFVNYAMAVKRTSIIFSGVFGFMFFKEKDIFKRLTGAVLITAGIFVIYLA